ncbi:MAG: N-acetyltransferase [Bacteroidia bacterium]|nr:N-acetyltransferase [Bacteroidia bacterium]
MGKKIHPSAIVETDHIGEGTRIWAFVHILPGAAIGNECNICDHCFIEGNVRIGNHVTVKSGVHIWSGVNIADHVFIGPGVAFTNDLLPRSGNKNFDLKETFIAEGASLGANASIRAGVRVGKYAMVGMGSVVTRDVPDFAMVFGNPAVFRAWVGRDGKKLIPGSDRVWTSENGESYIETDGVLRPK